MPAESPGEAFDTAVLVGKGKVRYGCLGVNKVIRGAAEPASCNIFLEGAAKYPGKHPVQVG